MAEYDKAQQMEVCKRLASLLNSVFVSRGIGDLRIKERWSMNEEFNVAGLSSFTTYTASSFCQIDYDMEGEETYSVVDGMKSEICVGVMMNCFKRIPIFEIEWWQNPDDFDISESVDGEKVIVSFQNNVVVEFLRL